MRDSIQFAKQTILRKKDRPEKQVSPFVFKQCVAVLQHHNLLGEFS